MRYRAQDGRWKQVHEIPVNDTCTHVLRNINISKIRFVDAFMWIATVAIYPGIRADQGIWFVKINWRNMELTEDENILENRDLKYFEHIVPVVFLIWEHYVHV